MKLSLYLLTLSLLVLYTLPSCTGSDSDLQAKDTIYVRRVDTIYAAQPASIYGLWIGLYDVKEGSDAGEQNFYYSFALHKDKTIQVTGAGGDGMTYYGIGTWTLQHNVFTAHITTTNLAHTGLPQTIAATYDSTHNKLSGTVTNDVDNYQATFVLEKVQ